MAGGTVYPMEVLNEICDGAHAAGLKVHLDGARIFNAAAYLGVPVGEIAARVDSVMFCLSKGLGAPSGSMLVGSKGDIDRARSHRKRLGGGMRQVGVLAATGLVALDESPALLAADHANARFLGEGLAGMPGIRIDPARVQTNIVVFRVSDTGMDAPSFSRRLKERGVLAGAINPNDVRMVTHYDVSRADCERALEAVGEVCGSC
jgi:threonine aldolase